MISVSIVLPCYKREKELRETLRSIRAQKYLGKLEIIVVEDGNDGGVTESVANQFYARFIQQKREEVFPLFQSPGRIRNIGLHAACNEIVIFQDADMIHESTQVIQDLVQPVAINRDLMTVPLVRRLKEDGSFYEWYNHPTEGPHARWILGGCPQAAWRERILGFGGYEESFFGHGFEDNFFDFLVRRNGISVEYVTDAVTAHQCHATADGGTFEQFTGLANWALMLTLLANIHYWERPAIANLPIEWSESVARNEVVDLLREALRKFSQTDFDRWAPTWIDGSAHPAENREMIFVAGRAQHGIEDKSIRHAAYVAEHAAHAAWSYSWADACLIEQSRVPEGSKWAERLGKTRLVYLTWAQTAMKIAHWILAGGEIKR
jgi:glycosyltransferase involved in cell wall biosynthesis